jgi:hypothetical protein
LRHRAIFNVAVFAAGRVILEFWADESGLTLSAEMVTVSTLGVIAATTGLSVAANAVNEELADLANALRSLDQGYVVSGFALEPAYGHFVAGPSAWTASSGFVQQDTRRGMRRLEYQPPSLGGQADVEPTSGAHPNQTAARYESGATPAP